MPRNLQLYPWYLTLYSCFFWLPVFFLYFSRRVSPDEVLILEAIYYAAVVLLEVPSGYASDRLGRKLTLLLSALCFSLAYTLFAASEGFLALAVAQALLGAAFALNSGTDSAFHYDSLQALGREAEFGE